uniref:hypothetical protein n=1 Tax=Salmonella enterica TaxID=28901 RepID=UPI0020C55ECB
AIIVEINDYERALKYNEIERKNLHTLNENLITECVAQDVFFTASNCSINASKFHELSVALKVSHDRVIELEKTNSKLNEKIELDDHDNLVKHFSKLEVEHFNLQLKYQHLKENVKTSNINTSSDA